MTYLACSASQVSHPGASQSSRGSCQSGHGMAGRSIEGHGMDGRSQAGQGIRPASQIISAVKSKGMTTLATPPTTCRAAKRRGLARIRSSRSAAGDPSSGMRSRPPVPMSAADFAPARSPSNQVARSGAPTVVKRARIAPTSSTRAWSSSGRRWTEFSVERPVAICSSSTHHVASLRHPSTEVSTRCRRPCTVSS